MNDDILSYMLLLCCLGKRKLPKQHKICLTIPLHQREDWLKLVDQDGATPAKRMNYQYGVKRAVQEAGLTKTSFVALYRWVRKKVTNWMKDLRQTGLGNPDRGQKVNNSMDDKLVELFKLWTNKYNADPKTGPLPKARAPICCCSD